MSRSETRPAEESTLAAARWREAIEAQRDADDGRRPSARRWTPQRKDRCQGCGGHVSAQYRKSLGDPDDVAHACPNCVGDSDIYNGAAADPDWEKRVGDGLPTIGGGGR